MFIIVLYKCNIFFSSFRNEALIELYNKNEEFIIIIRIQYCYQFFKFRQNKKDSSKYYLKK